MKLWTLIAAIAGAAATGWIAAMSQSADVATVEDVDYWKEKAARWEQEAARANNKLMSAPSNDQNVVLIPKGTILESSDMETWSIQHVPTEIE